MSLTPFVFFAVLLAALCHASWNAVVKTGKDKLISQTLVNAIPGIVSLFALPFLPFPAPESWPYLLLSTLIHQAYYATLLFAYRHGDLSQVYPVARGLAPAMVATAAWILAGETLQGWDILGLASATLGIVTISRLFPLGSSWRKRRPGETHGLVFAFLTAVMIASYSVTDGLGVRLSGSPTSYIAWLFFLEAIPLLGFTFWLRRGQIVRSFRPVLITGLTGGLLSGLAYGIVIWAMSVAPLAHVVALRETSVIMAAIIGTRLLGEPFGRSRVLSAFLVAGGIAVMQLSG
ncbi:MAG: DMT family transporter [Kiloniellales bacterium]|nr:DMT family transporter [Kiloniellales bacterium]